MTATVAFEAYIDGAWVDMVPAFKVREDQPLTVKRGDGRTGQPPAPATGVSRLDNTDDLLRTSNPLSPLYETAGVGVPIRISRNGEVRGHLQAWRWACDESDDFRPSPKRGKAWVDVDASGLLQQVIASPRLDSPIIRDTLPLDFLVDFWPCEDESGATRLSNLVAGGRAAKWSGGDLQLGSDDRPGGAARTVVSPSGVRLGGTFQSNTGDGTGWTAVFAAKLPAALSSTYLEFFYWTDSTGKRWSWEVNNADYRIRVYDADSTLLETRVGTYSSTPNQWVRYSITASASGGTVSYETVWWPDGGVGNGGFSDTFSASSVGSLRAWERPATTYTVDAGLCSVYGIASIVVEGAVYEAFAGHRGELAGWRYARLLTELGFAWSWVGDPDDTMPMGAQPADTPAEILREIRDTEDGLIYDSRTALEVVMMTRAARYAQTPITVDVTELVRRPREVTDTDLFNLVTVSQRDGGEAIAADTTGPLGITAKGTYDRKVDVNVGDERLLDNLASWWLARGTVNQPRYPTVTINLFALGEARAAELAAVDVGSVLLITGIRADPVRVHVLDVDETVGWPNAWQMVLTCEPDDVFGAAGVYGTSRYDSASTTLAAAAEVGATTLSLTTSLYGDRLWSTTATPYNVRIAGAEFTVTSMPAPTGTGPWTHTATVIPGRNGVMKRCPAGSEVHVVDAGRYALSGE